MRSARHVETGVSREGVHGRRGAVVLRDARNAVAKGGKARQASVSKVRLRHALATKERKD